MKKLARDLKKGDRIRIAEQNGIVEGIEISDIGKQGKRKVRISALTDRKEKIILIRPEDYPIDTS
ncbi:MAG TPA: hypothetical protein VJA86_00625 [Candidatus Nanoarchaeia archaeon]|nr:hypothetical protein [Candidatus Nanoarchaeia archaeon]